MKTEISLNGQWKLYYYDAMDGTTYTENQLESANLPAVTATVPGNVELDLANAGIIPQDLFKGMNTQNNEKFESYEWWYETAFVTPDYNTEDKVLLRFEGVDTIADYYLNGEYIGHSENFFIPHEFDITERLKKGEKNLLRVHLKSSILPIFDKKFEEYLFYSWELRGMNFIRKPAHTTGWDIFPRAVSAGLWKNVTLQIITPFELEDVGYFVHFRAQSDPCFEFYFSAKAPNYAYFDKKLSVRIHGQCGEDSSFSKEVILHRTKAGRSDCTVKNPKLWWPYGYGDANIYDTDIELWYDGKLMSVKHLQAGLRKLVLKRTTDPTDAHPKFQFEINGVNIMCRGSNWVPLDAYHSRDIDRYPKAMELVSDIGCNMLRVWGGGVYEQEYFYDYCDRHGILIWQDFMFACQSYSREEDFLKNVEEEVSYIIRSLRHHPCIALWAGDNEVDEGYRWSQINPDTNELTRKILPTLVSRYDAGRPYLPSSPYISGEAFQISEENASHLSAGSFCLPEQHLWGSRDYYKADPYKQSRPCFISETGYHGCPSPASVKKIVDENAVWPCFNEQWTLHSSDQTGHDHRVHLMMDQINQLFAFEPDNLEDFSLASQISQAEAKKFFIEHMRIRKPQEGVGGILWWNLLDGWPQMSDAVVDYFYCKKLAYGYIKRSQAPFAIMMDEMRDWYYRLYASNDTLEEKEGSFRVSDLDTGEILLQGDFHVNKNENAYLGNLRMMYHEQKLLLITWNIGDRLYYNHYVTGMPPYSFSKYKAWLNKLQKIMGE